MFSVATPTRNSFGKLVRCVGSVRGQTEQVEHLIQDASSSDGTPAWLAAQADLKAVSEPDAGMYDAINRAWARSQGDVLSWLNADEQYLPGTLTAVASYLRTNPHVDVVFGDYIAVDGDGRPLALRREIPFRQFYVANTFLNAYSCTLFFRRRLLETGQLRLDERYRYAGDMDLMLRLARAGALIEHIPQYLSLFGIDGTNLSTHAKALAETDEIARRHGGAPRMRHVALALRRIERLVRGGYRAKSVRYQYALDEVPTYREQSATRLRGRYSLTE
jgi:glycosyltransferase involved in cell wall biosynthesis